MTYVHSYVYTMTYYDMIAVCLDHFAFYHQDTRRTRYSDASRINLTTK